MERKSSLCVIGFSLIELMVVIAIVAILAAVATPLYIEHLRSVKANQALQFIETTAQKMVTYYDTQGSMPTWEQMGFPSTSSTVPDTLGASVSEYAAPYIPMMFNNNNDAAGLPGGCPVVHIYAYVSNTGGRPEFTSVTQASSNRDLILVDFNYFLTSSGVWKSACGFVDANDQTNFNLLPGCIDLNSTEYSDALAVLSSCP